jgi:hypothetical protein
MSIMNRSSEDWRRAPIDGPQGWPARRRFEAGRVARQLFHVLEYAKLFAATAPLLIARIALGVVSAGLLWWASC